MKLSAVIQLFSAAVSFTLAAATAPPPLTLVLTANVTASEGINIGPQPQGNQTAYPITGGTFTGPRLKGKLLPVGADFSYTKNGMFSPDGISILQTDDGANILFQDHGFQKGQYVYGSVTLTTGAAKYAWLNSAILVSRSLVSIGSASAGVALEIFQVG